MVLSDIFFLWVVPYLKKGWAKPLEYEDVPDLPEKFQSEILTAQAKKIWNEEKKKQKPSLVRVAYRMMRFQLCVGVVLSLFQGIIYSIARPLLLKQIIDIVASSSPNDDESGSSSNPFLLLGVFCVLMFLEGVLQANAKQIFGVEVSCMFMSWMSGLVSSKAASLKMAENLGKVGDKNDEKEQQAQETTLVGTDIVKIHEEWKWGCLFPFICITLVGGVSVLILVLGSSCIVGLLVMFSIFLINTYFARVVSKVEKKTLKAADDRISCMKTVLASMKTIKMMAWEESFLEELTNARRKENRFIRLFRNLQVSSVNLGRASPILAACGTFLFLGLGGFGGHDDDKYFTPANVFTAIAAFQGVRMPLIMIPMLLTMIANFRVSFKRLQDYLLQAEWKKPALAGENTAVELKGNFAWPGSNADAIKNNETFSLKKMNITLPKSGLVAVVGKVGSGKSSLLSSVLGLLNSAGPNSTVKTSESVAYVPQSAFVLTGTIRDNITMGKSSEKNEEKLQLAVTRSCLQKDLEILQKGLDTVVGERGQTLSGGQKARLGLARALFKTDAKLVVLDDPLAAVDAVVQNKIFANAFEAFKDEKLFLVALNQFSFLQKFDLILCVQDGKVVESGTYSELSESPTSHLSLLIKGSDHANKPLETKDVKVGVNKRRSMSNSSNTENEKSKTDAEDLIQEESRDRGNVSLDVLYSYFKAMGWYVPATSLILAIISYSLMAMNDLWLAEWVNSKGSTSAKSSSPHFKATVYACLSLGHCLFVELLSLTNSFGSARSAKRLHNECTKTLMHAPISWYSTVPSGRILSRFSGDLNLVDRFLSFVTDDLFQFLALLTALCFVACILVPPLSIMVVLGLVVFSLQVVVIDRSNREVKRMANNALSPVLTNFGETCQGRSTLQAMGFIPYILKVHHHAMDDYVKMNYLSSTMINSGVLISNFVSFVIAATAASIVIINRETYDAGVVGLALTYCFLLPYFLGIISIVLPIFLGAMASLERILHYKSKDLPQEPEWELEGDADLKGKGWPKQGKIEFSNVSLRYRKNLPLALKGTSFVIEAGEKCGVVGRTGAGKSTLVLALTRVVPVEGGTISIDGVNIESIGIQTLRNCMQVIAQEPLLLRGNVRQNVDPFNKCSMTDIKNSFQCVGLNAKLLENDTDASNLSLGERQLLSLARALLRARANKSLKIVVMDEPTASIDPETDARVEKALSNELKNITLITIAHRIKTILANDKILVIDKGRVAECGSPNELLKDEDSYFYSLAKAANEV